MVKNIAFRINTSYNRFRANCQTIFIIYFHNTVCTNIWLDLQQQISTVYL